MSLAPKKRAVDPTTSDRIYSADEFEFQRAIDEYRRMNNRPFPTWSEALAVLKSLGYAKPERTP